MTEHLPKLVRLYIRSAIIGGALSVVFVAALLWLNVGNLWHLVSTTNGGGVAVVMLLVFNAIVFSSVQFGVVVMQMAEDPSDRSGRRRIGTEEVLKPAPLRILARKG